MAEKEDENSKHTKHKWIAWCIITIILFTFLLIIQLIFNHKIYWCTGIVSIYTVSLVIAIFRESSKNEELILDFINELKIEKNKNYNQMNWKINSNSINDSHDLENNEDESNDLKTNEEINVLEIN